MKTATTCETCIKAPTCPSYDPRMLYRFCRGYIEGVGDDSKEPYGDEDICKAEED